MRRNCNLLLVLAVLIGAACAGQPPGRFATTQDVMGFWEMLPLNNAEHVNKVNPWPLPYQWFGFYEDGTLASMARTERASYSRDQLAAILDVVKASAPKFSWSKGLMVVRYPSLPWATEYWVVHLNTAGLELQIGKLRPGDLVMTLVDREGKPVYYRVLRRLSESR